MTYIPKANAKEIEKEAIKIWRELLPNWKGSQMLFPVKSGYAIIDGGKIYKIITKAIRNSKVL